MLGALITLVCVAILLRQVDLKQSWNSLGSLNGPFLLVTLGVFLVNLPLRAWRWQMIFPSSSRPSFLSCLVGLGVGNMANFLLPGRAGDLARCVLVGRDTSLHQSTRAFATVALEKVLDGLTLVAIVLFSLWALHPPRWVLELVRLAALIFGVALVLLLFLRYRAPALINSFTRVLRRTKLSALEERISHTLHSFADGLAAVDSARQILSLLPLTAGIWVTEIALIWGLAGALRLALTFKSAAVASAVLGLGLMIPAAPGGLGTYELFGTEVFKLGGISASSALALTVLIHAWVFVANIVLGICLLAAKGLSLAQLRNKVEIESAASTSTPPSTASTSI